MTAYILSKMKTAAPVSRCLDPILQKLPVPPFMRPARRTPGCLPPPVPRLVFADAGNASDARHRPDAEHAAASGTGDAPGAQPCRVREHGADDMPGAARGEAIAAAGHAFIPHAGSDLLGLIISLPRGWSIPGRGVFSDRDMPADLPIDGADLRRSAGGLLSGNAGAVLPFPCMHAAAELTGPARSDHRHVVLKFNPALPAAPDGLLHFSFPPDCRIDYAPAHGKADFRLMLIPPEKGGKARILFHSFAVPAPDRHSGIRPQTRLSRGAFLEIHTAGDSRRADARAGAAVNGIRTEIINEEPAAAADTGDGNTASRPRNPGASMDFPALGNGDAITGLRFQAPDPSRGRIVYRGEPVAADADGTVSLGGDDFDPAGIAFSPAGEWEGTVRVAFAATIKNFYSKEERETHGTVRFTVAAPVTRPDGAGRGQTRGIARQGGESAAQYAGLPDSEEAEEAGARAPYPEPAGRPGRSFAHVTGPAPARSDIEEPTSSGVEAVVPPADGQFVPAAGGEAIRTVPRGETLHGCFPFDAVGTPGGALFSGVSAGGGDAVGIGPEGVVSRGFFGELRVARDGEFEYEADRDGSGPVWEYFTWFLYGADGRIEEGRLYVAVVGNSSAMR
ncbi:MAG: hypothetical protein LBP38_09475 [Desulfovibrio sp.]|jgi:hypothetical protein|nr:hypothetical protein [Desulfovibrio sp.]